MKKLLCIALPLFLVVSLPAFGRTYTVRMIKKGKNKWVYSPARLTIRRGDRVKFVQKSKVFHTVTFFPDKVPGKSKKLAERLSSKKNYGFIRKWGETYTVRFRNVPLGKYHYFCIPHSGMGMKGWIRVKR